MTNSGQGQGAYMRTLTVILVALLAIPQGVMAETLRESASRIAREQAAELVAGAAQQPQQPMGCSAATAAGQALADEREGMAGYLVGGLFIPIIMPLIGLAASPQPQAADVLNVHDDDLACFQDGYRDTGRGKKVRGGWIGSGIGIGLGVLAYAALVSELD